MGDQYSAGLCLPIIRRRPARFRDSAPERAFRHNLGPSDPLWTRLSAGPLSEG